MTTMKLPAHATPTRRKPRLKKTSGTAAKQSRSPTPLSADQAVQVYRLMLQSRRIDDAEILLKRQNLAYFQISGAGHEATLAVASLYLRPGVDWFFPYYRDRALCLGLGVTPTEMLLQTVGAAADPASGGRQMPSHWGNTPLHIVSEASTTGTQFLTAVGCAEAGLLLQGEAGHSADEVVYCSAGDGTTSQGFFFEALNTACLAKLPVIFHIEDNGYAISVPVEHQTAGGNISKLLSGYPTLLRLEFDGCDPQACAVAWQQGVAYARARRGPVLLHAHVIRPYSHSLSDDERLYRTAEELAEEARRDPLVTFRQALLHTYSLTEASVVALELEVQQGIETAKTAALAAAAPAAATATRHVYSETFDPCAVAHATQPESSAGAEHSAGDKTMVDLINACLVDEMQRNPRVVVFGEDVADASRAGVLEQVKGKGGVFKVTHGLQRRFGEKRVFNTPLSESNIVGRAIGMAMRGIKPVVEIQFFDYIWPAMMHIRSEMALLRWRSNNGWACPLVIRTTYGGFLKGGAVYHSQTGESIFTHIPGLRVVLPATAQDANGLLRMAIRCEDPVLFLEHKHLYRQTYNRQPYPGDNFVIPFGKASCLRQGSHLTLVTYGAMVKRSLDAVAQAHRAGIDVELLDLRSLSPYDWEAIAHSVKKTGKALLVHEDSLSWGYGAEIAARIADELFDCLDGPVRRLASKDTFVGYHPDLEDAILPQTEDVLRAIKNLAAY
jgi:2-oxoisovalerate dehydrogenase E1 component